MTIKKNDELNDIKSILEEIKILNNKLEELRVKDNGIYYYQDLHEDLHLKQQELTYKYIFYLINKDKDLN